VVFEGKANVDSIGRHVGRVPDMLSPVTPAGLEQSSCPGHVRYHHVGVSGGKLTIAEVACGVYRKV
jgi:hypothetical protein